MFRGWGPSPHLSVKSPYLLVIITLSLQDFLGDPVTKERTNSGVKGHRKDSVRNKDSRIKGTCLLLPAWIV
jgi:hypothetical protein